VAKRGGIITYGELKAAASLTHPPNGMKRLLDLVSRIATGAMSRHWRALSVNSSSGEVGPSYEGDPSSDRQVVSTSGHRGPSGRITRGSTCQIFCRAAQAPRVAG
jgi:hypothetical protein